MTEIITFTGVQGSGKTTMRRKLVDYLRDKGYDVISQYVGIDLSISRDAQKLGFILNESTNFNTQYYLATKYIVADLETRMLAAKDEIEYIILDRSPLDVIPYSENASYALYQKKLIRDLLMSHFIEYPSAVVYCTPLEKIKGDGLRSVNSGFQEAIEREFASMLTEISSTAFYTTLGLGSIEKRFDFLKKKLEL